MKKSLILFISLFALVGFKQTHAKDCYLLITNPATFKHDTVFEIASALIKNFIAKVKPVPRSGLGENDCVYNLTVFNNQGAITTSITGPEINSIGETTANGILGLQKAILLAIYRSDEDVREEICDSYQSLVQEECKRLEDREPNYTGVWYIEWEEDNEELYAAIDEDYQVLLCELKKKKVEDLSEGYIENGQFVWGEGDKYAVTLKGKDTLVVYFQDPESLIRVEKMPDHCVEQLKEEEYF